MTDREKLRQHMNITTTVELRITPPHYCDSALQITWRGRAYQKTACSNLVFDKITAKEVVRGISSGASKVSFLKQAPNGFGLFMAANRTSRKAQLLCRLASKPP